MKKLVLIIASAFISAAVLAQAPRNTNMQPNPNPQPIIPRNPAQGQTDPTILSPAPNAHPATPATMQRADSPLSRQRDTTIYRQRYRTDSLPQDDRDPNKIPRMDRDSLRK